MGEYRIFSGIDASQPRRGMLRSRSGQPHEVIILRSLARRDERMKARSRFWSRLAPPTPTQPQVLATSTTIRSKCSTSHYGWYDGDIAIHEGVMRLRREDRCLLGCSRTNGHEVMNVWFVLCLAS